MQIQERKSSGSLSNGHFSFIFNRSCLFVKVKELHLFQNVHLQCLFFFTDIIMILYIRAGTGPAIRFRSGRTGPDRTGPDKESKPAGQNRIFAGSSLQNFCLYFMVFHLKMRFFSLLSRKIIRMISRMRKGYKEVRRVLLFDRTISVAWTITDRV